MCGIAGFLGPGATAANAEAMAATLQHRGPDGLRVESRTGIALGHARLSIIDLEHGWQPIHAAGCSVVGNGELYNYVELAEEFGLQTATGSDFEPMLHLFAQEGPAAFERLRGMYAMCVIGADGRTFLARDPFGIKPLYYREDDDGVAFASEPHALLDKPPKARPEAIEELLALNYTLGDHPAFAGVKRVRPGEVLEVVDGRVTSLGVGKSMFGARPPSDDEETLLQALDAKLENAVLIHQRSDVPYGVFLSGGIDSGVVATLMAGLNDKPVTAYTCGFDAPGARDERAQAEKMARSLNLDWHETRFDEEDFWRIAPLVAARLDDPTTDYATLPTYKLAEAAKGTLTVVLTGEGGDELFGGYGRYRRALRPRWLGGRPPEPQLNGQELPDQGHGALARWRDQARPPPGLTRLQQAQWSDMATWLPNDLLLKLDRCLMAHGLEGRTPFLEPELARFALGLPDRMKVRGRHGKWLLRRWLDRNCPAADPFARKQGFTVPVAAWIAPRANELAETLCHHAGVRAFCHIEAIESVFSNPAHEAKRWPLLFFALWWSIHIERVTPDEALEALVSL